ncbi:MAG: hypothetical protein IPM66_22310 [Acidobacteriota bacterium]|nr:MAG: hypothetical protein IPM66_22310 [Acidobacteriota bacterium]
MSQGKQKEPLFIYTADGLDVDGLTNLLGQAQVNLEFLSADFWNDKGIFYDYASGIALLQNNAGEKLRHCISGTAFGKTVEISWREVNERFRVVVATEQSIAISGTAQEVDEEKRYYDAQTNGFKNPEEIEVILWGSDYLHEEKLWVEGRIPRPLSYPVEPKMEKDEYEAVFLKVKAYYDRRGRPIIYRKFGLRAQANLPGNRQ